MDDLPALDDLIRRLEAAEGPSRELDDRIAGVLFPREEVGNIGERKCLAFKLGPGHWEYVSRLYTRNIDAALTLVPEGLWHKRCYDNRDEGLSCTWELWPMEPQPDGSDYVEMYDRDENTIKFVGHSRKSMATAFVIAALKAHRAMARKVTTEC